MTQPKQTTDQLATCLSSLKIVEKCILEQFTQHCNDYDLLPPCQSAYQKFHSCETSLVKLINDLLCTMENQQVASVVILDL